ncbi:MAG: hypothetical protein JOZ19_09685 [Rubrobacter sp.]|nr:hypothetical protein [Rubrobacter sp.]
MRATAVGSRSVSVIAGRFHLREGAEEDTLFPGTRVIYYVLTASARMLSIEEGKDKGEGQRMWQRIQFVGCGLVVMLLLVLIVFFFSFPRS